MLGSLLKLGILLNSCSNYECNRNYSVEYYGDKAMGQRTF